MDFFEQLEQGRYGSFELKRQVGPNLLKGLLVSLLIHGTVIASPFIIAKWFAKSEAIPAARGTGPVVIVKPPPLVTDDPFPITSVPLKLRLPDAIKVTPVPVTDNPDPADRVPDQRRIKEVEGGAPRPDSLTGSGGGPLVIVEPPEDTIPDPGIFVFVEVGPAPVTGCPEPEYPDLAKTVGMPGLVIAQMYVDKNGNVKKWLITKVDPAGVGFEESVAKVVPQWKFRPAIQGGNPIGVWVSVPFRFKVKN